MNQYQHCVEKKTNTSLPTTVTNMIKNSKISLQIIISCSIVLYQKLHLKVADIILLYFCVLHELCEKDKPIEIIKFYVQICACFVHFN